MTLTKEKAKETKEKVRTTLEEIVKLLEEEGFSHSTAVMLAPEVIRLLIDRLEEEMRKEK